MNLDKLAKALCSSAACQQFTADEAERLAAAGDLREIAQGEPLVREGDTGGDLLILLEGSAVAYKHDPQRKEPLRLNPIGVGEVIGEMEVLVGCKRTATVEATAPCTVFVIPGGRIREFLERGDPIASKMTWKMATNLADRLAKMNTVFFDFMRLYAKRQPRPGEFETFKDKILKQWDV
jgi:CRP/FNR family cyclic AMP-dependent transcriptional regulator